MTGLLEVRIEFTISALLFCVSVNTGNLIEKWDINLPEQGQIDIKYSIGTRRAFETSRATVKLLSHDQRRRALITCRT